MIDSVIVYMFVYENTIVGVEGGLVPGYFTVPVVTHWHSGDCSSYLRRNTDIEQVVLNRFKIHRTVFMGL